MLIESQSELVADSRQKKLKKGEEHGLEAPSRTTRNGWHATAMNFVLESIVTQTSGARQRQHEHDSLSQQVARVARRLRSGSLRRSCSGSRRRRFRQKPAAMKLQPPPELRCWAVRLLRAGLQQLRAGAREGAATSSTSSTSAVS